jgi:RHS repeat-associated protein
MEAASTIGDDDNSFAGQRLLTSSDPIFMAAYREYDPSLGRWTSEDPIGFTSGSPNFYSYVEARALTAIDPSGLVAWDVDTKITYVETTMLEAAKACQVANPICGCTTYKFLAAGECKCENGQYKMTLSLTYKNPTIHIARDAWTPMWVIRRHEEGHASDHQRILQERKTAGELLEGQRYGSKDRCEFEKDQWAKSVEEALRGAARGRDVHYKRLCG